MKTAPLAKNQTGQHAIPVSNSRSYKTEGCVILIFVALGVLALLLNHFSPPCFTFFATTAGKCVLGGVGFLGLLTLLGVILLKKESIKSSPLKSKEAPKVLEMSLDDFLGKPKPASIPQKQPQIPKVAPKKVVMPSWEFTSKPQKPPTLTPAQAEIVAEKMDRDKIFRYFVVDDPLSSKGHFEFIGWIKKQSSTMWKKEYIRFVEKINEEFEFSKWTYPQEKETYIILK